MTITESRPHEHIGIRLEFVKPFKAVNPTTFDFAPEGEGTRVTWTMSGKNNFIGKAMCLFMDMDKMVGGDFEKGLAALEKAAQANPVAPPVQPGSASEGAAESSTDGASAPGTNIIAPAIIGGGSGPGSTGGM
jgi:hypothetical protein